MADGLTLTEDPPTRPQRAVRSTPGVIVLAVLTVVVTPVVFVVGTGLLAGLWVRAFRLAAGFQ